MARYMDGCMESVKISIVSVILNRTELHLKMTLSKQFMGLAADQAGSR